ncbi:hypothetical protein K470DRAFT_259785 [Piedraia hortae CBS 480.64]|uniref:Small ribosomal subunit protein uS3m n=1 Tax=Piedraia hortae CBS 480.64 TaxID=1314780 RepID=A0A6A7BTB2_9PEZI|nr:hypothetical protein K470DRAFT_259785 [Piedraia hortae CBS 480.64]
MSTNIRKAAAASVDLLDPARKQGIQSLLSKVYNKPVELRLVKHSRPHLDGDILAGVVAQQLQDMRAVPRRIVRDAAWKMKLPSKPSITNMTQARFRPGTVVSSQQLQNSSTPATTSEIMKSLRLRQVTSVRISAAGRLSSRLTADRSQKKEAQRGPKAALPGHGQMVRGYINSLRTFSKRAGKRRIGGYGVKVSLGHR